MKEILLCVMIRIFRIKNFKIRKLKILSLRNLNCIRRIYWQIKSCRIFAIFAMYRDDTIPTSLSIASFPASASLAFNSSCCCQLTDCWCGLTKERHVRANNWKLHRSLSLIHSYLLGSLCTLCGNGRT